MTTSDPIADQKELVAEALAAGRQLHVGVTLSYVGGSSDKFWSGMWVGNLILVNYGPNHVDGYGPYAKRGQYQLHNRIFTVEQAAAAFWDLLRKKTGKGYAVVDAAVMVCQNPMRNSYDDLPQMMGEWNAYRDARSLNPRRAANAPVLLGTSPLSAKAGGQVMMNLTNPQATSESLLEAAMAAPAERFLTPIALSRPDAPEEARFLAALGGGPGISVTL